MTHVSIRGLRKEFSGSAAVDGIDIEVESGTFVTLLGPSGCGKTTTLRCLAGLETPTSGQIYMDDEVVADPENKVYLRPEKRRVGMVFQSYGLWPHMTVEGNVSYPLRLRRMNRKNVAVRVHELLAIVELEDEIKRPAAALSGGQQQRVALARALANDSSLVLYDEPLSNLDARLRASTRDEIRSVHNRMGTTSVLVTHDQEEALTLADKVVVMNRGRIEQIGTPQEVYGSPRTVFVARFMGVENIFATTVIEAVGDKTRVQVAGSGLDFLVPGRHEAGQRLGVAFRAAHVRTTAGEAVRATPMENEFDGVVSDVVFAGQRTEVTADVNGESIRATLFDGPDGRPVDPRPGDKVHLVVPSCNIASLGAR